MPLVRTFSFLESRSSLPISHSNLNAFSSLFAKFRHEHQQSTRTILKSCRTRSSQVMFLSWSTVCGLFKSWKSRQSVHPSFKRNNNGCRLSRSSVTKSNFSSLMFSGSENRHDNKHVTDNAAQWFRLLI
ncbi:hypothetical protein AVEN_175532-1 [Araneus ventricosus]|uniref:Uncharacterized protein n=1 Tax=Araneus ventricosus TaxID=182803 RepID=A0A4Y2CMN4_ARAVE|nr:hypothetical protein AVEN_175532-1 [Araneus ventricosus]